jgi:hypothetical protein
LVTLFVLFPVLAWALFGLRTTPASTASSTPVTTPEATPLSAAIVDDVTIALTSWQEDAASPGRWIANIQVSSAAALSVRFVSELITLNIRAGSGDVMQAPLPESTLPCSLAPGERATITLLVQLEPGHTAVSLTIGLQEVNRSGAQVVFPLGSGTGAASATGGDGAAGANATGGDAIGANATPGMSASSAPPAGQSSPAAGPCTD